MPQNDQVVRPAKNVTGAVRLPGDKSVSHRYCILAALADGRSTFRNFSTGADCRSTMECVSALGCSVEREGSSVRIAGLGPALRAPSAPLDCGNSGSTMRMLAGVLAGQSFTSELRGDLSLSRRPMGRVIAPLRQMGANIESQAGERPPLRISGGDLRGIEYEMPLPSAQVKTAVLLAGLLAGGETVVSEAVRTRDHTELALRAFGATISRARGRIALRGGQQLRSVETTVPGDLSSAAFFLCAAALFPESNLLFEDLLLNPTRAVLLDVLIALGARLGIVKVEDRLGELVGTVHIDGARLGGAVISGAQTAALIDEIPVLAAIAPHTAAGIEVRDARELRVKESDRLAAVAANLRAMGAEVQEFEDGIRVPGNQCLHGAEVDSFGDHRIAMAFAVTALRAGGDTLIHGAECAAISFPEFFQTLDAVVER